MEAVYQWIRQIAVFAVISFLVLYLMGSQDKKTVLRFYLSLLMLLLVLKPAAALLDLNQILTEKLTELEAEAEMSAVNGQIQQVSAAADQEFLDYTSERALSWIENLVQDENLVLQDGKIDFDEKILEQTGEVVITGVEVTVYEPEQSGSDTESISDDLENKIARAFELDENAVMVRETTGKAGGEKGGS